MLFSIKKTRSGKKLLAILLLLSLILVMGCVNAPSKGWSGPIVDNDNVLYVGTIQGKVIAYDLSTGEPVKYWEKEIEKPSSGSFSCGQGISTPMSTYGVPALGEEVVYVGGYDGYLYSFTRKTGAENKYDTGSAIVGSPVFDPDTATVFIGSSNGKLYALYADLREDEKWIFKTGDKIWSAPVVDNGVVYVSSADHRLYALDIESGKEIWRFEAGAGLLSTPLIENNTIYIGAYDNKFYAIETATEEQIQAAKDGEPASEQEAISVFNGAGNCYWTTAYLNNDGDKIFVGNLDHKVYILDANDISNKLGEYKTGGRVTTPAVEVQGRIIFGSEDGKLYYYDTEQAAWDELCDLEAPIFAPMVTGTVEEDDNVRDIVYVHAQNGSHYLHAIYADTGLDVWDPIKTS